jgi:hypothetical protein
MENTVASCIARWNIFRILSFAILLLTFGLVTISFPPWPLWMTGSVAIVGVLSGLAAVLKGDRIWARGTSLIIGLMFFISLFWRILSATVEENLAMLLLLFVLVLFSIEDLNLLSRHQKQYSKEMVAEFASSITVLQKSMEQVRKQIGRLGLIFGSCYIITIGIVYIGALLASFVPVLSDYSLYVVVVSTSLALLMIIREEQAQSSGRETPDSLVSSDDAKEYRVISNT